MKKLILILALALGLGTAGFYFTRPTAQEDQPWSWVESEVETGVVRVTSGNHAGSGVVIYRNGDQGLILTAAHVIGSDHAFAFFADGTVSAGPILASDPTVDLAIFAAVLPPAAQIVPLAASMVPGDSVTLVGFGGPTRTQRAFEGVLVDAGEYCHVDGNALFGDSGGAILQDGKLIGIIGGGMTLEPYISSEDGNLWPLVSPILGAHLGTIRAFLAAHAPYAVPPELKALKIRRGKTIR